MTKLIVSSCVVFISLIVAGCGGGGGDGGGDGSRNAPPVASDSSIGTAEDTPAAGSVNAIDADGNALVAQLVSAPTKGDVVFGGGLSYTYTPRLNANGNDTFTVVANDGKSISNVATVTIAITAVNDSPVLQTALTLDEDTVLTRQIVTEVDGESSSLSITSQPLRGTLTLTSAASGTIVYTPAANYNGADAFSATATDASGNSSTANVQITVRPMHDAPEAKPDFIRVAQGEAPRIAVTSNDVNIDGDPLTVSFPQPTAGSITKNPDNSLVFTPPANFFGSLPFTYSITDQAGTSSSATVTIAWKMTSAVVFLSDYETPGKSQLYYFDGTQTVRLNATLQSGETIVDFKTARNASLVFYTSSFTSPSRTELHRVALSNPGSATLITANATDLSLSDDGSRLAFQQGGRLKFVNLGSPSTIVDVSTGVASFSLNANGQYLYYRDVRFTPTLQPSAVYRIDTQTMGAPQQVTSTFTPPNMVSALLRFSANGTLLYYTAFTSGSSGSGSVFRADLQTPISDVSILNNTAGVTIRGSTSDASTFWGQATVSGTTDIYSFPATASATLTNLTNLASGASVTTSALSDDGTHLYYAKSTMAGISPKVTLYQVNTNSPGLSTKIAESPKAYGVDAIALAPSNAVLFYSTMDQVSIGGNIGYGETDIFAYDPAAGINTPSLKHFGGATWFGPFAPDSSFAVVLGADVAGTFVKTGYVINSRHPTQLLPMTPSGTVQDTVAILPLPN